MTRTIRFYNRGGRWYADLPDYLKLGGTEEECEMVLGSDDFLWYIDPHGNELFITLSDKEQLYNRMYCIDKNEHGATYEVDLHQGGFRFTHQLWLCPVTLFLFNRYPGVVYWQQATHN
jgi:hypothetical protein